MQIITNYSENRTTKRENILELKPLIDTNCQQVIMKIVVHKNLVCFDQQDQQYQKLSEDQKYAASTIFITEDFTEDSVSFRSKQEAESNLALSKAELQTINYLVIFRKMMNSISYIIISKILPTFDRKYIV